MVKRGILFFAFFMMALFLCENVSAQTILLEKIDVAEDNSAVKILFSTNKSVPVECYDLNTPPQIVVDFMGEIYADKPEVILVNKGAVKQMRIIKGTKKNADLGEAFYSIDFIIVDLQDAVRYDFDRGLTNSVLYVSKPGQALTKPAQAQEAEVAKVAPAPAVVPPEPAVTAKPEAEVLEMLPEQEEPVAEPAAKEETVSSSSPERPVLEPAVKKKGTVSKVKSGTKAVGKSISSGAGKVGKGIKNLFTFGKNKKEKAVEKKTADEKPAKRSSRRAQTDAAKQKAKLKAEQKKTAKEEKIKKEKPVRKKSAPLVDPSKRVEIARQNLSESKARLEKQEQELSAANADLELIKQEQGAMQDKISAAQASVEEAQKSYEDSLAETKNAKEQANGIFAVYNDAKLKLTQLLEQSADAEAIAQAQKDYELNKTELENAIAKAKEAKQGSDAKLTLLNQANEQYNALLASGQDPRAAIEKKQGVCNKKEKEAAAAKDAVISAENELADAELSLKQYEIAKADEEYMLSLAEIDSSIAKKLEDEKLKKEAEQARLEEEQRNEEARIEQEKQKESERLEQERLKEEARLEKERVKEEAKQKKASEAAQKKEDELAQKKAADDEKRKEEARLAALRQVEEQKKTAEEDEETIAPKRRKTLPMAEKKEEAAPAGKMSAVDLRRSEVLRTALELRNAGLEMQKAGDLDSAIKYYQQALLQDSNYVTVHNDLGIIYEQKGLEEKAKMEYMNALKIDPNYIKAHSNLALLYEKQGDLDKAYYHWKQRVRLGNANDPWTQKAKQRMEQLEKKK